MQKHPSDLSLSQEKTDMKRLTIIVPVECFEELETCLCGTGIHGLTVTEVRGFGEHANFYQRDLLVRNIRVDIYAGVERADRITDAVINFKRDGYTHMGILAVEPVERFINLFTGKETGTLNF